MMQPWFQEAKLGIFIHYGIYSVKGTAESWYFRSSYLTKYRPYMKQIKGFTAKTMTLNIGQNCLKKQEQNTPFLQRNTMTELRFLIQNFRIYPS